MAIETSDAELIDVANSAAFLQLLATAIEDFNLAPDVWIDVKRLPVTVVDFPSLVAFLKTVKTEIGTNNEETKTSGRIRLYKLFTCCIHGLHAYCQTGLPNNPTVAAVTAGAMAHAGANEPGGLSANALKLWQNTFANAPARTRSVMKTLVYFMARATQAAAAAGVPQQQILPVQTAGAQQLTPQQQAALASAARATSATHVQGGTGQLATPDPNKKMPPRVPGKTSP